MNEIINDIDKILNEHKLTVSQLFDILIKHYGIVDSSIRVLDQIINMSSDEIVMSKTLPNHIIEAIKLKNTLLNKMPARRIEVTEKVDEFKAICNVLDSISPELRLKVIEELEKIEGEEEEEVD